MHLPATAPPSVRSRPREPPRGACVGPGPTDPASPVGLSPRTHLTRRRCPAPATSAPAWVRLAAALHGSSQRSAAPSRTRAGSSRAAAGDAGGCSPRGPMGGSDELYSPPNPLWSPLSEPNNLRSPFLASQCPPASRLHCSPRNFGQKGVNRLPGWGIDATGLWEGGALT